MYGNEDRLRERLEQRNRLCRPVRTVAGADAAYTPEDRALCAAAVLLDFPSLSVRRTVCVLDRVPAPYRPGFLGAREAPGLVRALARLRPPPEVVLVDAHGVAHPRGFGAACLVGVLLDLPAVGVAKERLVGTHGPLPPERGAWVPLERAGEVVGAAVRTRAGANPVYVSVGHRVDLETAVSLVLACTRRFRLPEPIRAAHRAARGALRAPPPVPSAGPGSGCAAPGRA